MDKADSAMEDAANADEPGADGAEPKKQYLLDRIATSDGFKDAKAHKEDADAAPETTEPVWKRYVDATSGRPYWHNAATDKTTWADPTKEESSGEDASPPILRSMKRLRKARRRPRTPPPSTDWRDGSASRFQS